MSMEEIRVMAANGCLGTGFKMDSLRRGLTMKPQKIQGMWSGIRGSTVFIDTPASLCYIVD